jgi:glycosyltransferase involved in cell wall biosynthesis
MTTLSLIIPCYNESKSLPLLLSRCADVVNHKNDTEIIIVDNGSTDDTHIVLDSLVLKYPFIVRVRVDSNQGYGNGILAGLSVAKGDVLSWTHADMQTDPTDVLIGIKQFDYSKNPEELFVKGRRYGRSTMDVLFTIGMAIFETLFLRKSMWDINAQPTIFHRKFFEGWQNPPSDFSLDLYAYYMAKFTKKKVIRFPVRFSDREHGNSHWNIGLLSKYKFIRRTLEFSVKLRKEIRGNA